MRRLSGVMILAGATVVATAVAASRSDLVRITVPAGFEGPTSADPGPGAHTDAYVRHLPGQEQGTLLQITTFDFDSKLKDMPKEELADAAEHYLLQFLRGVERKRTDFHASKPARVSLGKIPGARVEWTGMAQGEAMSGVMYCVIVGTTVVEFHTQVFQDSPSSDRADALRAIESVSFDVAGQTVR